jgi:hypothetical protein
MNKFIFMQDPTGRVFETGYPELHGDCKRLKDSEGKRLKRLQDIETVKGDLRGVDCIYGIVRKVSASGMSRNIDLYIIKDNAPVYLTGYAAAILGWKMAKDRGMIVNGCGMDMVFHAGESLVRACGFDYKNFRFEAL